MKKTIFFLLCFTMLFSSAVFAQPNIDGFSARQWLAEAEFQFTNGDLNRCISAATNAVTLDESLDYAYFLRGASYSKLKVYHQAISELSTAIRLNPNDEKYYKWRGYALSKRYIYDEAIADYSKVLQLVPNDLFALSQRGQIYASLDKHNEAIADFDRVINLAGRSNYFAYYWKAESCEDLGLKQQAIDNYKTFIELAQGKVKQSYITHSQDRISELSK